MIRRIKFTSIPVQDQDAALDFYTSKLGFRVATDQPLGEQRWIELRIPGADTRVVLYTPPGQEDRIGRHRMWSLRATTCGPLFGNWQSEV